MLDNLISDLRRYPGTGARRVARAFLAQGFWAVVAFRIAHSIQNLPVSARIPAKLLWMPVLKLIECATGIQIGATAAIGPGLYIGHFGCLVVSGRAVIGERCNLSQGVTIGLAGRGESRGAPTLGDRVYVAAGAKIIGKITIGDDVAIGANAVVTRDVPPGVTVAGVPARIIAQRGSEDYLEVG